MILMVFTTVVLLYSICVITLITQWTPFTMGFKEVDGSYTSKYYQIACHVMRKAFILTIVSLGYSIYWIGNYSHLY